MGVVERFKQYVLDQIDQSAQRFAQLGSIRFGSRMPQLAYDAIVQARYCYAYGLYSACTILCGAAIEAMLRELLEEHYRAKGERPQRSLRKCASKS